MCMDWIYFLYPFIFMFRMTVLFLSLVREIENGFFFEQILLGIWILVVSGFREVLAWMSWIVFFSLSFCFCWVFWPVITTLSSPWIFTIMFCSQFVYPFQILGINQNFRRNNFQSLRRERRQGRVKTIFFNY